MRRLGMASSIALLVWACGDELPKSGDEPRPSRVAAAECSPWPAAAPPAPASTAAPLTTCTPVAIPPPDPIVPSGSSGRFWPIARDEIYVALRGNVGSLSSFERYDGHGWTREVLPAGLDVLSVWSSPSGNAWAAAHTIATDTRAPGFGLTVLRRRNGVWEARPPIEGGTLQQGLIAGADDDHVLVLSSNDTRILAHRSCGETWVELPITPAEHGPVRLNGSWTLDATHIFAFGGGADVARKTVFAQLILFDGASGREIPIPVPLSDIGAMAGTSMEDLYVAGLDRNIDGTSRLFHVTNGLATWTPVAFPPSVRITSLATRGATTYMLGCDLPDQFVSATDDCARFARLDGANPIVPSKVGTDIGVPGDLAVSDFGDGKDLTVVTAKVASGSNSFLYRCE